MRVTRRSALAGALSIATPASASADTAAFRASKQFIRVRGCRMAYASLGEGDPIVFVHGNPTSSFLWRDVMPGLSSFGRCIAPDLVGMGDSDKLPNSGPGIYTFAAHSDYFASFMRNIGARRNVTLVLHDWGGPIGFEWARRNTRRVKAIAFMETFVVSQNDNNTPAQAMQFFTSFRTPDGERRVLQENGFVENVLLRQFPDMSETEKAEYRRPFREPGESRRPTLEWPRQVPINGDPRDVHEATLRFLDFMAHTPIPKLFIRGEPGGLIRGGREDVPRAWPNVTEAVVAGGHFLPEHAPQEITRLIAGWLPSVS